MCVAEANTRHSDTMGGLRGREDIVLYILCRVFYLQFLLLCSGINIIVQSFFHTSHTKPDSKWDRNEEQGRKEDDRERGERIYAVLGVGM